MKKVTNYMEVLVERYLESCLENWDVCKCSKCKKDITALALNNLKPMYTATETGDVYVKVNTSFDVQFTTDVLFAINKAISTVSSEVRHE
jgi:competence protein ComFB